MYIAMRPHLFGYPADLPEGERKAIQANLRAVLVADDIPRFLGYLENLLAKNGNLSCQDYGQKLLSSVPNYGP
jgi:hypothetical protein